MRDCITTIKSTKPYATSRLGPFASIATDMNPGRALVVADMALHADLRSSCVLQKVLCACLCVHHLCASNVDSTFIILTSVLFFPSLLFFSLFYALHIFTIMDLGNGLKEEFPGQWAAIMNAAKEERLQKDRDRPMPVSLPGSITSSTNEC